MSSQITPLWEIEPRCLHIVSLSLTVYLPYRISESGSVVEFVRGGGKGVEEKEGEGAPPPPPTAGHNCILKSIQTRHDTWPAISLLFSLPPYSTPRPYPRILLWIGSSNKFIALSWARQPVCGCFTQTPNRLSCQFSITGVTRSGSKFPGVITEIVRAHAIEDGSTHSCFLEGYKFAGQRQLATQHQNISLQISGNNLTNILPENIKLPTIKLSPNPVSKILLISKALHSACDKALKTAEGVNVCKVSVTVCE
ncbi:hypothetical protein J6590_061885 [Homalodisca vitripennis]|nr:hypothetical protein J6590_061885 [Homalodisca vitripennis]